MNKCICLEQLIFDLSLTISLVDVLIQKFLDSHPNTIFNEKTSNALRFAGGEKAYELCRDYDQLENVVVIIGDRLRELHQELEKRSLQDNQTYMEVE